MRKERKATEIRKKARKEGWEEDEGELGRKGRKEGGKKGRREGGKEGVREDGKKRTREERKKRRVDK